MLNVKLAYPGILGAILPNPPDGFLPEGSGFSAIDRRGVHLNWNGSAWVFANGTLYNG
jgi:hypothetical protein